MSNKKTKKPQNKSMLQVFEWYLDADSSLWRTLEKNAQLFKDLRINKAWLPPAYKGSHGVTSVGYDVYDKYDLGNYKQKGTTPTKYGTREEYKNMLKAFRAWRVDAIADIVMNHMFEGDKKQNVEVHLLDPKTRIEEEGHSWFTREFPCNFTFEGRGGAENADTWTWENFSGLDQDGPEWEEVKDDDGKLLRYEKKKYIFKIKGKEFVNDVDWENRNYDFLMGCNLDFTNEDTCNKVIEWGKWYLKQVGEEDAGIEGFRIDAVKHISNGFMTRWLNEMRKAIDRDDMFAVGEYWHGDCDRLYHYLDTNEVNMRLFDVPLHYQLWDASRKGKDYPLSNLFKNNLLAKRGYQSVMFVDNHDTQPGQALTSNVLASFKPQAYAFILFQKKGIPCTFYGDLFGLNYENYKKDILARREDRVKAGFPSEEVNKTLPLVEEKEFKPVKGLPKMLRTRCTCAHGPQSEFLGEDRIGQSQIIGYTRQGDSKHKYSGMAVMITNDKGASMNMYVCARYANETMIDILHPENTVTLDEHGSGTFTVADCSAGVWVREIAYRFLLDQRGFVDYISLEK